MSLRILENVRISFHKDIYGIREKNITSNFSTYKVYSFIVTYELINDAVTSYSKNSIKTINHQTEFDTLILIYMEYIWCYFVSTLGIFFTVRFFTIHLLLQFTVVNSLFMRKVC